MLLKDVENTNLSGKTLTVDFGSYTSDELLKSIGVKDVNGGMTAETMTQFAVIGSDENGEQLDNSAMIMGMTGTMMQIFGLDASVDNFAADDFYLIATDINFGAVTPIANLSTLIIYNDYTFPFGLSDYNSVNGTTTGSTGETPIADDSIIWNCLKVVE